MKMHTWPVPYVAFVHGKDEIVGKGIEAHFHRILARLEMQICAWVDAQEMRSGEGEMPKDVLIYLTCLYLVGRQTTLRRVIFECVSAWGKAVECLDIAAVQNCSSWLSRASCCEGKSECRKT